MGARQGGSAVQFSIGYEGDKSDDPGGTLEFRYNPDSYSLASSAQWGKLRRKSKSNAVKFNGTERDALSLELFFDTFCAGTDVRKQDGPFAGTDAVVRLAQPTVGKGKNMQRRPPVLTVNWGRLTFPCVLESVTQNFTLFFSDGVPARALLRLELRHYVDPKEEARSRPDGDPTKVWTVTEGETLPEIAAREYDDPGAWRLIADANDLADVRTLPAGMQLSLPADLG